MSGMRTRTRLSVVITAASLSACALRGPLPPAAPPSGPLPAPTPEQPSPAAPERPAASAPRQFHLRPAASALVTQAHTQAGGGDYGQAAATLERALRIEPDNPLLWIELGRVQLSENNAAQADAMGRKALALATTDAGAQSAAWRLIADSLRLRSRNPEAAEADARAGSLAPR